MRKITLLFTFLLSINSIAQTTETISFESSEGFTLGNLSGQNDWGVTEQIVNQIIIVDDKSTDGENSLFLEGLNSPFADANQNIALVGAFSDLFDLDDEFVIAEFDIFLTDIANEDNEASDFIFQLQSTVEQLITSRMVFNFQDNIQIVESGDEGPVFATIGTFDREEWISVKIIHDFDANQIGYYINNELVHTGDVWGAQSANQIVILYDNFDSSAYIDNILISDDEVLSNEEFIAENDFVHFTNNNLLHLQASSILTNALIYDMSGRQVVSEKINNTNGTIDLNMLSSGMYIVRVATEDANHSFKIVR